MISTATNKRLVTEHKARETEHTANLALAIAKPIDYNTVVGKDFYKPAKQAILRAKKRAWFSIPLL